MCLGVPMRVVALDRDKQQAVVESSGNRVRVNIALVHEVTLGDYLLVHAGFAIAKLSKEMARESLAVWEELIAYEGH